MKFLLLILLSATSVLSLENQQNTWEPRIINGREATAEEFPHHVALRMPIEESETYEKCGGSLITVNHVLTAAHCFDYSQKGEASLGSNKYMEGVIIPFDKVTIHENFYRNLSILINDIAIVHLSTPATPNGKTISIIALDIEDFDVGFKGEISGFGWIGDGIDTNQLYAVSMTRVSSEQCSFNIVDSHYCLKGNFMDNTCRGDSGGALVRYENEKAVHVGLVSFGYFRCKQGKSTVFTRTLSFKNWIEDVINKH